MAIAFAIGATPGAMTATVAAEFWMREGELRNVFAATTIRGEYVDGRTFSERYEPDGRLSYHEEAQPQPWTGRWSVVRDRFCTIYDRFGTGGCFRVHRISANCFEFYFDTRTEEEARQSTLRNPSWTARAWRSDTASTCEERPMV